MSSNVTLPEHIKKNWFYRKIIREVYTNEMNAQIIIIGKPGLGKFTVGQKICQDLDKTFNINRIVYSMEEFLELLDKGDKDTGMLHAGQAILFDEIVTDEGAESRGAMSKSNKLLNYVNANYRARRLIVVFCLPSLMQLDKAIREVNTFAIIEVLEKDTRNKRNKCKLFYTTYDAYTQKPYRKYPRLIDKNGDIKQITSVWIGLPDKEFMKQYKVKKMAYLKENISRWSEAVKQLKKNKENKIGDIKNYVALVKSNPGAVMVNGKFNAILIAAEHNIGINNAKLISGMLNKQITKKAANYSSNI